MDFRTRFSLPTTLTTLPALFVGGYAAFSLLAPRAAMPAAFAQAGAPPLPAVTKVPPPEADAPNSTDKSLAFGHVPDIDDLTPRVRAIEKGGLVARNPKGEPVSASDWMNQSMKWMQSEDYVHAAYGFQQAAAIYRERGEPEDALVMSTYAARCESRVGLFYERTPHVETLRQKMTTGRRLEPVYGAYIGAFIDHEQAVGGEFNDEDESTGRPHRDAAEFDQKIGKKHAAFFTYCGYKSGKPDKWFANLKDSGAAAQWAIEPRNLDEIQDDDWLHNMAQAAADAGVPVFVRFASEMNGGWTPYHTPPALYREKFQLVARVFHQVAPNAAMVWCPNEIPQSNIADYYPGDDAVDWVGVNFYSVYYNNGDPTRQVAWANPADKLDYVYQHYSAKHPIMICEWAATHHERADGVDRPSFAAEKIAQLYSALPRRFPRVKAVFWLDMNAIEYADDPRTRKNDYSLLSSPQVAGAYKRMVSSPYFLDHVSGDAMATSEIAPLAEHTALSGQVTLSAYVKTYEGRPTVVWTANGRPLQTITDPGAYECTLNTADLPNGPAKITATVLDAKGRVAGRQTADVLIQNGNGGGAVAAVVTHAPTPHSVVVAPLPPPVVPPAAPVPVASPIVPPPAPVPVASPIVPPPAPVPVMPPAPAPQVVVTPAPVPVVPAAPGSVTIADALAAAKFDSYTLSLDITPPDGAVVLGSKNNNGIRVTAAVGGSRPAGASPTLIMLLLHGSGDDATVETISAVGTTDEALAQLAAAPGSSVSIPKNPRRVLRPDAAGSYIVRAVLLPTRDAARALVQALSGNQPPVWKDVLAALRGASVPADSAVYIADKSVTVVTP